VLFVGINPGLRSAEVGHHFAGPSNRFWRMLAQSGLVPEPIGPAEDARLLEWGYGLTNLVPRPTAGVAALRPRERAAGARRLASLVRRLRPALVALVGVTIYRTLFPKARTVRLGPQRERLAGAPLFVLPNPSGRNAHVPTGRMIAAFRALRRVAGPPAVRLPGDSRLTGRRARRTMPPW
jgi:TDG/mug DNA glycosylase family protein